MNILHSTLIPVVAITAALFLTPVALPLAEAETLAERQARTALELKAEGLLARLHDADLDAELEPCINGAVSPSGRFANAALEYAVERLAAGDLTEHLDESTYFRAFNDGHIALRD
jgi:hypothetical protein